MEAVTNIGQISREIGEGTLEKPRIKFYLSKPGVEISREPDIGNNQVPAFHCLGDHFSCDFCGKKFISGADAVTHRQLGKLKQVCIFGKKGVLDNDANTGTIEDSDAIKNEHMKHEKTEFVTVKHENEEIENTDGFELKSLENKWTDTKISENKNAEDIRFEEKIIEEPPSKQFVIKQEEELNIKEEQEQTIIVNVFIQGDKFTDELIKKEPIDDKKNYSKLSNITPRTKVVLARKYFKENNEYVCKICNHRAKILASINVHIKRKHTEINCNVCPFMAQDFCSLKEHCDQEHGGTHFPCKLCDSNLVSQAGLRKHEQNHHRGKLAEDLHCDQCAYVCVKAYLMKNHVNEVHNGRKKKLYPRKLTSQCEMCDFKCSGPSTLKLHMGAKHGVGSETFYCDQCDFKSSYLSSVNNHKKCKHDKDGENVEMCGYCNFTTKFKQYLQTHIENKHLGIKHNCDECDYSATSTQYLKLHKKSQHLGIRYQCDQCDYTTNWGQSLTIHKNSKHIGIQYPCDKCDYIAKKPKTLYIHKQGIHENIRFNCDFCDYSASFKGNLRTHKKKCFETKRKEIQKKT